MENYLERFDLLKNENKKSIIDELNFAITANKKRKKTVTFFGGTNIKKSSKHYNKAFELSYNLSKEGFSIITGGGPGIMEAANKGSFDQGGYAIGYNIKLPAEQQPNPFVTEKMDFKYFFSRKISLMFFVDAYVFCPGGFGTMDELFELLTLIKTEKINPAPVILLGEKFWQPLDQFIKNSLLKEIEVIETEDTNVYKITDDINEAINTIKKYN